MVPGRILAITSNFPRWCGDSTTPFVLHLAQDLCALGWQIDVLAPHAPGAATEETFGPVRVRRFRYFWPEAGQTVCYQGGALINLRQNKSNWLKLPMLVGMELQATLRELSRGDYDLLHSHWALPQGFVGALAARRRPIPHVLTVHGSDVLGLNNPLLVRCKRHALEQADAVTVNSSVTERAVRNITKRQDGIVRIAMGVTNKPPAPQPSPEDIRARYRRGNGPLIGFVGRLVTEKGVDDLLRALSQLSQTLPDATAMIIGEGQERQAFEALAKSLGVADRAHFLGWVEPDQVSNHLAAADIFTGPSKTSSGGGVEAQGLTYAEAMLAGTPVIGTRNGGIVDTVRHEETGLLVDEAQPRQIAAAIERLHRDAELAARLVTDARAFCLANRTRDASAQAFSTLFSELVGARAHGRPR